MRKPEGKDIWFWDRASYDLYQDRIPSRASYPKSTQQTVSELRQRGLECNYQQIHYFIRNGKLPTPLGGGPGGDFAWTKQLIDRAAEFFADNEQLMPRSQMCLWLNLSFGQLMHALLDACQAIGPRAYLGLDETSFKMVVTPSDNMGESFGVVEFLPRGEK